MESVLNPLEVNALCKDFRLGGKAVRILTDITFSALKGQFIAIMGPSGSGKSTLLHVIAGLTGITSGKVVIGGEDVSALSDAKLTAMRRRKLGFVFQAFNLIPSITVAENILLPLQADGVRPDRNALTELARRLGIEGLLNRHPDNLSGGEQQRAAIARALLPDPALILADEPTGSLDSAASRAFCELLRELCEKDGRTILAVTHEPAVAAWADRLLILRDGHLAGELNPRQYDTTHSLAGAYQDLLNPISGKEA